MNDRQIHKTDVAKEAAAAAPEGDPFFIELERFSGPLDLLLHLIKQHEMDIFDIPIAEITEKYLAYVAIIRELDLDRAGDFLVMASTLAHIKSRMLLPPGEDSGEIGDAAEELDPRADLVRRLLAYQKYKDAAERMNNRLLLNRDVYARPPDRSMIPNGDEVDVEDVPVIQLIELFQEMMEKLKTKAPHRVRIDEVKIEERISDVLVVLRSSKRVTFRSLLTSIFKSPELITTFLAVLELARVRVLRLFQAGALGEIYISLRPDAPDDETIRKRIIADQSMQERENTPTEPTKEN